MRLSGKVAIITGAGQGLGREFAMGFAREGAKVVIAEINFEKGQDVARKIGQVGGDGVAVHTDVRIISDVNRMAKETAERFGKIDVLVNNAAVFYGVKMQPFDEILEEDWDRMMAVNLKGTWNCVKAVFPYMKAQGAGKIINVGSDVFNCGTPFLLHYVTSKGGVVGMSRALAKELGPYGINVNCINPGYTSTEASEAIRDSIPAGFLEALDSLQVFKRREQPSDLVGAAIYFASDESNFVTGQSLVIDGGITMH